MTGPFARSLTLRLLAIFALIGVLVLVLLVSLFSQGLSGQWRRSIQPHLAQYIEYVQDDLGMPPDVARADDIAAHVPVDIAIYRAGQFVHATTDETPEFTSLKFGRVDRRLTHRLTDRDTGARTRVSAARDRSMRVVRIEQADWSVYYILDPRRRRSAFYDEMLIALAAVGLVMVGGWWIIRRQLRPIAAIKQTVADISDGDLHARTGISGHDDLATLGSSIDGMASRLQGMLNAKRELLLSVSHELRSPVTRARVALELLPESTARDRINRDLVEMSELIDALLESERLREAHTALNTQQHDVRALVSDTAAAVTATHPESLSISLPQEPLIIDGDPSRLTVLARTLIHNAVTHGTPADHAPKVHVTLTADDTNWQLDVEDEGDGIEASRLESVTEPFERLDESRSRNTGGVGLGLTLAKLVAEAHGGSLTLENRPEGGLRATARLPLRSTDSDAVPA